MRSRDLKYVGEPSMINNRQCNCKVTFILKKTKMKYGLKKKNCNVIEIS